MSRWSNHADCTVLRSWEEGDYHFEDHEGTDTRHVVTDRLPPPAEFYAAKEHALRMVWRLMNER